MSLKEIDRLRHMRDAARDACTFMAGKGRADLTSARMQRPSSSTGFASVAAGIGSHRTAARSEYAPALR